MAKRIKHTPTKKQEKAFQDVIKAINKAKSLGLHFYGKQWDLVAYTDQANEYLHQKDFMKYFGSRASSHFVPWMSAMVLDDSGADDFQYYLTDEDAKKFNR